MLNPKDVERLYENFASHEFEHVERVHKMAMKIAKQEKNVNMQVLDAAAWLHDIARGKESKKKCACHAKEGAKMAAEILLDIGFKKDKIKSVIYAIASHRYSTGIMPKTKEAAILQDADRLDAIGAIAIARIFTYGGYHKRPIYDTKNPKHPTRETGIGHFYEKQLKLKPSTFHTRTARKIAKKRYDFIKLFLKEFHEELK